MSTDPKIDLFARDLFNALWKHHGLIATEPPDEHSPTTEFNESIFRAVQIRQAMFHAAYEAIFENTHAEFAGNSSYFFDAIVDFFPHYPSGEDPEEESVMCMFLSSCAFVADMCMLGKMRGEDFLDAGLEAWAMFADLYLNEAFHAAGGWKELQFFAKCDLDVYDYMRTFSEVVDCDLGKEVMFHDAHLTCAAVDSFNEFEEGEGVDRDAPYALKWVDFCVQVPFRQISSPDYYSQPIPSVFDQLEAVLWSLTHICNPLEDDAFSDDFDDAQGSKTGLTGRYFGKILELDGESATCATSNETSLGLRTTSSSASFDFMDHEKKDCIHEQTDSKVMKTGNEESILYNKITSPVVDNPSSESMVGTFRGLEEALSSLLSQSIETPDDPSYFCSASESDNTQPKMNTNPDDFDTLGDHFSPKTFSDSKSRVKVFAKTIPHDNTSVPYESLEKTPNRGLLSPCKSPLTSPAISFLNTPDRPLFRRMNSTGSDGMKRKKQTGKENSPSHRPKPDIKKNNNFDRKPLMVTTHNSGIKANGRNLKEDKEDKYTKSTSIDQSLPIPKFISLPKNLYSVNDETDSSKDDQDPSLLGEDIGTDEKLVCLDKSGMKTHERSKWLELKNKISNKINIPGSSLLDDEVTSTPTSEQLKTENVDKADAINVLTHKIYSSDSHFESLPKVSASEDLNSLRCQKDDVNKKSSISSSCLKVTHQNSILTNDDENYHIFKKPLKTFEPTAKNKMSRPLVEKERSNRQISQGSSNTEIYEMTKKYNFSADSTKANQFKVAAKKRTNEISYLTQLLQTSSLKVPHQNSILRNDDENYHILEKSLTVVGPTGKNDLSSAVIKKEYEGSNRRISQGNSSTETYEKSSEDPTVENQFQSVAGAKSKSSFNSKLYYGKLLGKTGYQIPSVKPTNENPIGFDGKEKTKPKKELNSKDSNREASTSEPQLKNPVGFSSKPQDVEKKGKKRRPKKRLTRLEQRVKEEGDAVHDVTRLIFVMGHRPGMASVASVFHDFKKQISKDDNNEE